MQPSNIIPFGHKPGSLVRAWPRERIEQEIAVAGDGIRAALRRGDMDAALALISRKVGLRVCAGQIAVRLKKPNLARIQRA